MKLNIHSVIDVITNSSTEIYTFMNGNSVEKAHELLNEVLKVAGSSEKSEDLFDIKIISYDCGDDTESELEIKSKDTTKSDKNIWRLFWNLFDQNAEYNG